MEEKRINSGSKLSTGKWNAEDYAQNSSAQKIWADELLTKLNLKGNEYLLDIGCGNGLITNEIACSVPNGFVVGIDSSENMIALASKTYVRKNLSFFTMSATEINLDKKFNIAFSNATLHWVKDHFAVLIGLKKHLNQNSKILFQMGGSGNAKDIIESVENVISRERWKTHFVGFEFPYFFYSVEDYENLLPQTGYKPERIVLIPKDMIHDNVEGLTGWIRTTWFPYTNRLPEILREEFIAEIVSEYLVTHPVGIDGRTHVKMVRLEVEATVIKN